MDSTDSDGFLDDVPDDAIPSFGTMDEDDHGLPLGHTTDGLDADCAPDSSGSTRPINSVPFAAKACLGLSREIKRDAICSLPTNPRSAGNIGRPKILEPAIDEDSYECPVCRKTLRTDNQGLNSHVDFCLSRGAIRQAHAEATSFDVMSRPRFKPISKGKGRIKKR